MALWHCYFDESYKGAAFCVGGFLGPAELFEHVGRQWQERLDYENRRSVKKGFPLITRYHATDCAGLKKEFAEKKGWSIPRQILLTQRLCEIIGDAGPVGIVIGGLMDEIRSFLPPDDDSAKETLYDLCFRMVLLNCSAVIRQFYPGNTINVFYDQSKNFGPLAQHAFQTFRQPGTSPEIAECLIDAVPKDSRTSMPLQAADFLAYEGFRCIDGTIKGKGPRKSINALRVADTPLLIDQFTGENYLDLGRMVENRQNGRPFAEGVTSRLKKLIV